MSPSKQAADAAMESYRPIIQGNHGTKAYNLEKLFYPLGVVDSKFDLLWLTQMNDFGKNRGGWAHASIKARTPPDPASEPNTVNQRLQGLLRLDRTIGQIR